MFEFDVTKLDPAELLGIELENAELLGTELENAELLVMVLDGAELLGTKLDPAELLGIELLGRLTLLLLLDVFLGRDSGPIVKEEKEFAAEDRGVPVGAFEEVAGEKFFWEFREDEALVNCTISKGDPVLLLD